MARPIEAPTETEEAWAGDMTRAVKRHPAFAQIAASRVSGHVALYDSDFRHNAYMTVTIRRSELHRDLSHDWHFGKAELIEIAMSEAQWATFVSSPNVGQGVPCTLQHLGAEVVPGLPDPQGRHDQFGAEVKAKLARSLAELDALAGEIDACGLSAKKAGALKERLRTAKMQLAANLPFVAETFSEHMEKTVEKAKGEIHGYMTGVLMRSGLEALTSSEPPLQIEASPVKPE